MSDRCDWIPLHCPKCRACHTRIAKPYATYACGTIVDSGRWVYSQQCLRASSIAERLRAVEQMLRGPSPCPACDPSVGWVCEHCFTATGISDAIREIERLQAEVEQLLLVSDLRWKETVALRSELYRLRVGLEAHETPQVSDNGSSGAHVGDNANG